MSRGSQIESALSALTFLAIASAAVRHLGRPLWRAVKALVHLMAA